MNENFTKVLFYAGDALLFFLSLIALISLIKAGKVNTNLLSDRLVSRDTVTVSVSDLTHAGYTVSGVERYDGQLSGQQVYTDILNTSEDTVYLDNGSQVLNLSAISVSGSGETYLSYARQKNPALLQSMINFSADYIREYHMDINGKTVSVTYRILEGS